jgi:DNA-binding MarR family transcriptional regulator
MEDNQNPQRLDAESKALEAPAAHHDELRLWLRLLTCSNLIESEIRTRLRERFDVTLPRFDLMAQLDRAPGGMTLSEVSQRMMVTNGNVTHVVDKLLAAGTIARRASQTDRRAQVISLTDSGRAEFRAMAAEHETWLAKLFGGLTPDDMRQLMQLLARAKHSVHAATDGARR